MIRIIIVIVRVFRVIGELLRFIRFMRLQDHNKRYMWESASSRSLSIVAVEENGVNSIRIINVMRKNTMGY